jgi:hypothetical protein
VTVVIDQHTPLRSGFDCATCGQLWPCAPAKVLLCEQFEGRASTLVRYLGAQMGEAVGEALGDRRWGRVDDMYQRFVGWVPRGDTPCCVTP